MVMPNTRMPPMSATVLENPAVIIQRLSTVEVNLSSLSTHLDGMAQRMDQQAKAQSDKIDQMFTSFDKRFSEQLTSTNTQLAERGKTPWGLLISAMGVMIVIVQGLSSLQFAPVRADIDRLNLSIGNVAQNTTSSSAFAEFKSTYENNRITSRQDNDNRFASIEGKFQSQVPRGEHERVWASYDQRFTDVQRQVDEVKAAQGSVYGARDVILDLRERLDRVERGRVGQP
jgi:DNA anti-recombination protein RmuC